MQDLQANVPGAAIAALNELNPTISPSNLFYTAWPLKCATVLGLILQAEIEGQAKQHF